MEDRGWPSLVQAAQESGLPYQQLWRLCASGQLPCRRVEGRVFVDPTAMRRLMADLIRS